MRHVVVGAFSWPPCFALIPRALIGFIRAVALGDITLTVPSLPVIGTDANVMPERECKMHLCLKRTAMVERQDVQRLVEADGFHFPAFHFRAVPDQVAFAHREYS